ncbi:5-oxoprolinase subunit C family protein [Kyrpidia tusciae]|uniref:Urea amidolyase related protein n=1 Tax=Kyrpidia tusciae (strain DSM 2912 / NBRC 15312 / T2) TaxID=562970 RepID=D5WUZ2_KYRT2|nr:biotin-dependent carboxyltransferase family protein [Kyrpidia tusciae]ADG07464.1 urea amidolyase related protein [Kyrpidia tusciae DSM 2912]
MIRVVKPGLLTTVQDCGRVGYQKYGVIVSGAMDGFALRVANLLVGNPEGAPAVEMTLVGPRICFEERSLIAITGAGLVPRIDGAPVPLWRPVLVRSGAVLDFDPEPSGCRMYLGVAGGIDVPKVMGSGSTYLRAGIGGYKGRALQSGDVLPVGRPGEWARALMNTWASQLQGRSFVPAPWGVDPRLLPKYEPHPQVRAMTGPQFEAFSEESRRRVFEADFVVLPQSDRMGYRLDGPKLALARPMEMISEAVTTGTLQVPPDGRPILLLADHQTMGGYPKIAQVATVDLPVVAQVRPGGRLRFTRIELEEAQRLLRKREADIGRLRAFLRYARV